MVDRPVNKYMSKEEVFQDPTRKLIYAATPEDLSDLSTKIDRVVMQGIEQCDLLILTLGLTEVWYH